MAVEIRVPPLGESLVDAVVGTWLKQEGDSVNRGDSLVELETDKVNLDVTAEEDGVLARIERREGEVVTVGEVLGLVSGSNGASPPAPETATATTAAAPEPAPAPARGDAADRGHPTTCSAGAAPRQRRRPPAKMMPTALVAVAPPRPYVGSRKSITSISTPSPVRVPADASRAKTSSSWPRGKRCRRLPRPRPRLRRNLMLRTRRPLRRRLR